MRFLRLLKTGEVATQQQAGALPGLKVRQSKKMLRSYREAGLSEFVRNRYQGGSSVLSVADKRQLEERLRRDEVMSLEQGRAFLAEEFKVSHTIGGVSHLFRQMKVKLKTGRPSNVGTKAEAVAAFKKTLRLVEQQYQRRVYWGDEMRCGTRTALKRRWTPCAGIVRCVG